MRICVVGAGAVGGLIGARLAAAGHETTALARGATLTALRAHGWRVEGEPAQPVRASADPADLGRHDLVVVAVKATALPEVAEAVAELRSPDGVVLSAMNGVGWWFLEGEPLTSVDPGGHLRDLLPRDVVLGGVVHLAALCPEPGLVRHVAGDGLILGESAGGESARAEAVAAVLSAAGFTVRHSPDIRTDVWFKLWGNLTMNPISALTGATADLVLDDPLVADFCLAVMAEAAAIGARIGAVITEDGRARMAVTRRLGAFRTSMLHDADAGRPLELDALVGAVAEIGTRVGVPTPYVDALLGLTRLAARTRGLYPPPA